MDKGPEFDALRREVVRLRAEVDLLAAGPGPTPVSCHFLADTTITYIDDAYRRLFAVQPEDVLGRRWIEHVKPEERPRVEAAINALVAGAPEAAHEHYVIVPGGVLRWMRWINRPLPRIGDGPQEFIAVGIIGPDPVSAPDVELVARERDLLLRRFRLVFNRMPIGCLIADADLHLLDWNPAAEKLFGYPKEDMVGSTGEVLSATPESHQAWRRRLEVLGAQDATVSWVDDNLTRDGRKIVCEWSVTPLRDEAGRMVGALGMFVDITERRRAEERLRLALEASQEAYWDWDVPTGQCFFSPRYFTMLGYEPGEFPSDFASFLKLVEPADLPALNEFFETHRYSAGTAHEIELRLRTKQDTPRTILVHGMTVEHGPHGGARRVVGTFSDITVRKQLEEQLLQAQKLEAVGSLAGGVAHDFNNLLTAIGGYTELMLADIEPDDPLRANLEEVRRATERATALTHQLLTFSRRQMIQPRHVDLNDIVHDMTRMLGRLIGEDIELVVMTDPDPCWAVADPGQLQQVLLNLALNARDAMANGGRLEISTGIAVLDEDFARGHSCRPGTNVMLGVSDTGCGMTAEVMAHAFEPFYTTKAAGHGTGLGLATVYGIVRQAGGCVTVLSTVGAGTTFRVYLPYAEPAPSGEHPRPETTAMQVHGDETILLVEDDDALRALVHRILRRSGYTVIAASCADDAIAAVENHAGPIDLLLTDVVMPGLGGRELSELLGSRLSGLRVLFMSGYSTDAIVRHGIRVGEFAFLQKPFTAGSLVHKVREVLDAP